MSLSLNPLQTFVCLDPRINQHQNNEYLIKKGGSNYSYSSINANNLSSNSCTFTFNSPSVKNFIDKSFNMRFVVDFDFVGVNATPGTNLINLGISDAPQFKPLSHKLWDTITLTLNGNSLTVYSSDVMPLLDRIAYSEKQRKYANSFTPCSLMDSHMNYEDISDPSYPYNGLYSMAYNECGQYGQGGQYADGRGSFKYVSRTKISDNRDIIRYEFIEPLPVSPLSNTDWILEKALFGINTISINISFNSTAISNGAMWSHNNYLGNTITSVTTTPISAQLQLQIINPPETYIPRDSILSYKYDRFDRYITPIGSIPAGGKISGFTANSITIPIFPSRFIIAARRNPATMTYNTTETFGFLENLNITLRSKNGIVATFSPQNLWSLATEHGGVRLSWTEWCRDVGSVVVVPIEYCQMDDNEAAALQMQLQVQVRCDITNLNLAKAVDMELIIIAVNPGILNIEPSTQAVNTQLGLVTASDILNSSLSPHIDYHLMRELYGGDFASDLKTFGQKISMFAQQARPYVQKGVQLAKEYGPGIAKAAVQYGPALASLVGLGEEEEMGGRLRKRRKVARRRY
mgnify:CR=1 FL=1